MSPVPVVVLPEVHEFTFKVPGMKRRVAIAVWNIRHNNHSVDITAIYIEIWTSAAAAVSPPSPGIGR